MNATIKQYMETYRHVDPPFVDKFLSSIYVDDLVTESSDVESTYEFYKKSSQPLAPAGFRLRKFVTNSEELCHRIQLDESQPGDGGVTVTHTEEDQSYAKTSLGVKVDEEQGAHRVLGVEWNVKCDSFQFNIGRVATVMEGSEPTKRSVVSATAKFFYPLGIVSPVTISFKMFAQWLCDTRVTWNELLSGDLLEQWKRLLSVLRGAKSIVIPSTVGINKNLT